MPAAIIDATRHSDDVPPSIRVAGLSLIERSLRLAHVGGCTRVWIVGPSRFATAIVDALGATRATFESAEFVPLEDAHELSSIAARARDAGCMTDAVLLSSTTVYDRGLVGDFIAQDSSKICTTLPARDLVYIPANTSLPEELHSFEHAATALPTCDVAAENRPQFRIESNRDAERAEDWLWQSCRKDIDGIVARHLNRYVSLTISRWLAPTSVTPNAISYFTFSLGILAGVLAALGGWIAFAAAGVVFQINSIIDGCDGELARVKYEFSLRGEWLDTLSDDFSDVFFWTGLGIGAWHSFDAPWGLPPEAWLVLAGVSVAGKIVSMALYYRWLIANKRGDLLAFQWSFDDDEEQSSLSALLANLKYLTKKDFIVFAAMVMGLAGVLPYLLIAAAPGNAVVATSVFLQELKNTREESRRKM